MKKFGPILSLSIVAATFWGCGGGGGGAAGTTGSTGGTTTGGTTGGSVNDVPGNIVGSIAVDGTNVGVAGITVYLMDALNNILQTDVTDPSGFYGFFAPSNAAKIALEPTSIDSTIYYRTYVQAGLSYSPSILGCGPSIPTPGTNKAVLDGITLLPKSTSAPPPPPSCQ